MGYYNVGKVANGMPYNGAPMQHTNLTRDKDDITMMPRAVRIGQKIELRKYRTDYFLLKKIM